MTKSLIVTIVILLICSCENDKRENSRQELRLEDTVAAKNWLTKVIIDYRNNEISQASQNQLSSILTKDYFSYKSMHISLDYDTITHEQFDEKWKTKFQTKYVGKLDFFDWCQDCGPVEVLSCRMLKPIDDTVQVFNVILKDVRWQTNSEMDVFVIYENDKRLIADVRHYK